MASSKLAKYRLLSTVNVANFVSVRPSLNRDNLERSIKDYKIWKEQMVCLLESQGLLDFINGHVPPPLTAPEESMDEHKLWRRTDRLIKGWILGSINGTDVLDAVVGLESSREVWLKMENIFKEDNNETQNENAGKDWNQYLPLHRAALRGDWKEGKKFLDKDKEAITAIITESSETALHVAVETGKSNYFVRKLLEYPMPDEAILSKTSEGDTALHTAALAGNKEAAMLLVIKNSDLLYITNNKNMLAIHLAARNSHKDTLRYLISVYEKDEDNRPFVGKLGASLLNMTIASELIDVALYLVKKYPDLATLKDEDDEHGLEKIAFMPSVFPSGERFNWRQKWIYSLPGAKSIKNKKVTHQQTLELVKCLCEGLESLSTNDASPIYGKAIIAAAQKGIHEIVEEIIETFPNAIYTQESKTKRSIFHVAARERSENIFNLFYQMDDRKQRFHNLVDSSGNNFLHMCGELAPPYKLNLVSGAALQMQRELQWFKAMETFLNPSLRTWANNEGKTPQMLFTEKHKELKSQGEKWMKQTATSYTIAAALVATVVFAAAFTVPGGVHNDSGIPFLIKDIPFVAFGISDSFSLFTSVISLLMFLSILTSRYAEEDFLYSLPKSLFIGLLTLLTSITFMLVAFSSTIYITMKARSGLFFILVAEFSVALCVLSQFPLLIAVMYSTCGSGIFGKKVDHPLY